jgi:hypothetical protein
VTNRADGVNGPWNEIVKAQGYMTAVFHRYGAEVSFTDNRFVNMGIGVVIKG